MAKSGKKTTPKITFPELMARIDNGTLIESDAWRFFKHDEGDEPFKPKIVINKRNVDVKGFETFAEANAEALAVDAAKSIAKNRDHPVSEKALVRSGILKGATVSNPQIIAEGDSWFALPNFYQETMIDVLGKTRRVQNLGHQGDTLAQMLQKAEYEPYLDKPFVQALLFSGGGNDVLGLGKLKDLIKQRSSGDLDPGKVSRYVQPAFGDMLDQVQGQWNGLCSRVRQINGNIKIFVHGYDRIIPRKQGRWVGKQLEFRSFGFDTKQQAAHSHAMVWHLIDLYNERLKVVAKDNSNFVHVSLVGTIPDSVSRPSKWWKDELHPKKNAAILLAKQFDDALTKAGITKAVS